MISWLLIMVIRRKRSSFEGWEGWKERLLSPTSSSFLLKAPFLPSQPGKLKSFNCAELIFSYLGSCGSTPHGRDEALDSSQLPHLATPEAKRPDRRPRWSVCSRKPRFETSHSARPRPSARSHASARGPAHTPCPRNRPSVQFSRSGSVVSDSWRPNESQHARPPCPSSTPGVYSNSCPSSRWCHPTISSSVVPFSSCPQSLPTSETFPTSQLFAWGGQSIGVSASASVLLMNTQGWSPLWWTGWSPCSPRDSQESSPTPQFKSINFSALSFLLSPTLISHPYMKTGCCHFFKL